MAPRPYTVRPHPLPVAPAVLALASLLGAVAPTLAQPATPAFSIDGEFDEWRALPPLVEDPRGDAPGSQVDIVSVRGRADGPDPWPAVIRQLQAAVRLAGLAVYGSPYAWQALQPLLEPDLPAAWSPGQMALAQGEVLGRLGFGPKPSGSTGSHVAAEADFTD